MPIEIPALIPAVLAGFIALVALLPLSGVRRCWRQRRRFAAAHRTLWALVLGFTAATLALFSASLQGYRRLLVEAPVATVSVRQLGAQQYAVRVDLADGSHQSAELRGDEWQLDARVIKWTPRAVTMGAEPLYRVERISGRYRDTAQAGTTAPSVVDLAGDGAVDLWNMKRRFPELLPFIDADFGSAAYLPLLDGARYEVKLAATGGLVARPADADTAAKLKAAGW